MSKIKEEQIKYFQVFNHSTGRYVKYDREEGRIVDAKKEKGKYEGIPVYKERIARG
jgi:hypothetical protein